MISKDMDIALRKKLREQMNEWADVVATGACKSIEDYRFITGQIAGIAYAERIYLDLVELKEKSAAQLTKPSGYRILLALPEAKETYESGIVKADRTLQHEEISSVVGFALALGDDCYADKVKFPSGAWCKQGDFVLVGAYKGTRFKIHGKEFRMINDDEVLGVCDDPRGYSRAG